MKKTEKSADGTSFHNTTIITTVNELVEVLGEPTYQQNTGDDKVNVEWICDNYLGDVVTIYDWKEYRPLDGDETIEFHLGGKNEFSTLIGLEELMIEILKK